LLLAGVLAVPLNYHVLNPEITIPPTLVFPKTLSSPLVQIQERVSFISNVQNHHSDMPQTSTTGASVSVHGLADFVNLKKRQQLNSQTYKTRLRKPRRKSRISRSRASLSPYNFNVKKRFKTARKRVVRQASKLRAYIKRILGNRYVVPATLIGVLDVLTMIIHKRANDGTVPKEVALRSATNTFESYLKISFSVIKRNNGALKAQDKKLIKDAGHAVRMIGRIVIARHQGVNIRLETSDIQPMLIKLADIMDQMTDKTDLYRPGSQLSDSIVAGIETLALVIVDMVNNGGLNMETVVIAIHTWVESLVKSGMKDHGFNEDWDASESESSDAEADVSDSESSDAEPDEVSHVQPNVEVTSDEEVRPETVTDDENKDNNDWLTGYDSEEDPLHGLFDA
jgi:hypothetical protein